jgi:hypothetical protein
MANPLRILVPVKRVIDFAVRCRPSLPNGYFRRKPAVFPFERRGTEDGITINHSGS